MGAGMRMYVLWILRLVSVISIFYGRFFWGISGLNVPGARVQKLVPFDFTT